MSGNKHSHESIGLMKKNIITRHNLIDNFAERALAIHKCLVYDCSKRGRRMGTDHGVHCSFVMSVLSRTSYVIEGTWPRIM